MLKEFTQMAIVKNGPNVPHQTNIPLKIIQIKNHSLALLQLKILNPSKVSSQLKVADFSPRPLMAKFDQQPSQILHSKLEIWTQIIKIQKKME
jgi:hypothetical protein